MTRQKVVDMEQTAVELPKLSVEVRPSCCSPALPPVRAVEKDLMLQKPLTETATDKTSPRIPLQKSAKKKSPMAGAHVPRKANGNAPINLVKKQQQEATTPEVVISYDQPPLARVPAILQSADTGDDDNYNEFDDGKKNNDEDKDEEKQQTKTILSKVNHSDTNHMDEPVLKQDQKIQIRARKRICSPALYSLSAFTPTVEGLFKKHSGVLGLRKDIHDTVYLRQDNMETFLARRVVHTYIYIYMFE